MKILVDEIPTKVGDCPWSSPIKDPWKDHTFWFCDWSLSKSTETCPMANVLILFQQRKELTYDSV